MTSPKRFAHPSSPSLSLLVERERAPIARMLRVIAGASIAATLSAGCASRFDHPELAEPPSCSSNRAWNPLSAIMPAESHTHLALIEFDQVDRLPELRASEGTPCTGAPDVAACEAEFEALTSARDVTQFGRAIVSTDGGTLERWSGRDRVIELLGAIDTAEEALLLAWSEGFDVSCGDRSSAAVREVEGGFEVVASRLTASCDPIETTRFLVFVSREGEIDELEQEVTDTMPGACVGRRPEGLRPPQRRSSRPRALGAHLAEIARLEASAVIAFERLERELEALGAPASLLDAVREARADEVRHADITSRLAWARGGAVEAPVVEDGPLRDALALALENAVEGCVRETFGAVVGLHQAACAEDAELRDAMRAIAEDELRHAELSWRIAGWLEPRLDDTSRAQVDAARTRAIAALRAEAAAPVDPQLARLAGLPGPQVAADIVERIGEVLVA